MSGIKTSVKFGRIEFAFYSDLLELAQSSDYSVIEPQSVTQEIYHWHQFLHIRKVASDKIRKLRQLTVLLLVSVSYFLYLLGLLPFPLSGFVFKFKDAVLQVLVPAFQRFHSSTSEKRAHTACKGGCRIGGCAFEFVSTDFRFYLFQFLLRLGFLLLQQSGFGFKGFIFLFQVPIILHGGSVPCFRAPYPTLQSVFRHHPCVIVVVGNQGLLVEQVIGTQTDGICFLAVLALTVRLSFLGFAPFTRHDRNNGCVDVRSLLIHVQMGGNHIVSVECGLQLLYAFAVLLIELFFIYMFIMLLCVSDKTTWTVCTWSCVIFRVYSNPSPPETIVFGERG